jgi:hypothetical protein
MCNATGPKFFLPPAQLGSAGAAGAPVAYASSPQQVSNVSGGLPATAPQPTLPPISPLPIQNNPLAGGPLWGVNPGVIPIISRLMSSS